MSLKHVAATPACLPQHPVASVVLYIQLALAHPLASEIKQNMGSARTWPVVKLLTGNHETLFTQFMLQGGRVG